MYNISELDKMTDEDLVKVAGELGIKKPESVGKQELIYQILDEQAIAGAASRAAMQKANNNGEPKKRGRKKKDADQKPEQPQLFATDNSPENPVEKPEKPKVEKKEAATPQADSAQSNAEQTPEESQPKRRRGRPSKKDLEAREATVADEQVKKEAKQQPRKEPDAQPAPEVKNEQEKAPQKSEESASREPQRFDGDFNTFFPRGEGRKFVPRTQQEKEFAQDHAREQQRHQAETASQAPIVLSEPGQQPQQPQPGQAKKKKNKNNQNNFQIYRYMPL